MWDVQPGVQKMGRMGRKSIGQIDSCRTVWVWRIYKIYLIVQRSDSAVFNCLMVGQNCVQQSNFDTFFTKTWSLNISSLYEMSQNYALFVGQCGLNNWILSDSLKFSGSSWKVIPGTVQEVMVWDTKIIERTLATHWLLWTIPPHLQHLQPYVNAAQA